MQDIVNGAVIHITKISEERKQHLKKMSKLKKSIRFKTYYFQIADLSKTERIVMIPLNA